MNNFISYLEEQVENHSIYIWGAQGQTYPTLNAEWIKKKESGTAEKNALKMWEKAVEAGCEKKARAFDCSGLFIYYALENKLVKSDMTANGIKGKCKKINKGELRKGCFVFRTYKTEASAKKNGKKKGDAYHIGYVVDDELNVIHAKGRAYGVVKEKFDSSYWNYYAIPSWFAAEIEGAEPKTYTLVLTSLLKKGSTGEKVVILQRLLNEIMGENLVTDGIFGSKTKKAVKAFQKHKKLKQDGIVGENTVEALGGVWNR